MVIDSVHPFISVTSNVTSWNPQSLNIYCGVVSEEFVLFTYCPVPRFHIPVPRYNWCEGCVPGTDPSTKDVTSP